MSRFQRVTSYLVTNLTVTLFWLFFRLLNRTTVTGQEHVGREPNTLLLSNHQSMIDSFPVGLFAFYPRSWVQPHLIPWNPAAAENFYRNPILGWLADNWRCIPIREGRRDLRALHRMVEVLPHGVMTVFPEGGRSRTGAVGEGRSGAGLLILRTRPKVIPVAIEGMQDVLPIGKYLPRIFKRIHIHYGPSLDYREFLERPRARETAQAVVDKAMAVIRAQQEALRRARREEEDAVSRPANPGSG